MRYGRGCGRTGFTLLELLVTLVILAIILGAAGLAIGDWMRPPEHDLLRSTVAAARARAIATGIPVRLQVPSDRSEAASFPVVSGPVLSMTALPDGRVVASPELGIDPISGRPRSPGLP